MSKFEKLLFRLLSGNADKNFSFSDLKSILMSFDFSFRIKGSHNIFYKDGIAEIINIQEGEKGQAKPYQVKQVRELLIKYNLVKDESKS